jgi:ribosomal protein S12 methylthiotransferase accessory factor
LILEESACDLNLPDGRAYQAIKNGWLPDALKPWRADRAYLNDYAPDFRDVRHLMTQLQAALDPRLIEQARPWVDTPPGLTFADLPCLPNRSLATYRERIEAAGHEIFYADLTTPDIAYTGLNVARVLIPGLVPNAPAAFPPTGGGRVQHMAVQLGWRTTPLMEDELNYLPMPHA